MVVAAAALAAAALFLLLGPYSNFAPSGFLDPWFYTGYFTNFGYLIHHFGPTYFVGRLPWIIPGLLAFRIAPPEAASVMLNVAIVATSLIALYWAVRWHYGRTPAVLACACLLTNPYFMSTVSWDYPDGPAIAYAFVGLAFAVRPNGNRVWVGIFLTLSLLTNLAGAPMIAALLVLVFWRACEWKRDALRLAAGAVGTVLVLCPIAQVLVGRWTYFYWQVYQTIQTFSHPGFLDKMWGTGPAFLLTASRLFAPLLLVAAGPILLVRRKAGDLAWAAWISLAACLALFSLQEFAAHGVALRVSYHSSYLIVPLFFFAGVLLGETGRLSERWAAVAVLLAIALPFTQESLARVLPVWPALLVMGAVTLIARSPWQQLCLIAMLFLASGLDPAISYVWDRPAGHNREVFRSLMTLEGYLNSAVDPERRVQFWIDDEEQGPLYRSADALYLWIHSDFTEDLAHASAAHIRGELKANATLVHLTMHPEVLDARRKLLAARGIAIGNERTAHFPWATVVLQDVTDLSALR
ncbi:MAG: hypothetical protein JWP63_569 [Candidatus Solibacter sp.]|nr:hypothetical protein [Candidatus Solibacter sp.]